MMTSLKEAQNDDRRENVDELEQTKHSRQRFTVGY